MEEVVKLKETLVETEKKLATIQEEAKAAFAARDSLKKELAEKQEILGKLSAEQQARAAKEKEAQDRIDQERMVNEGKYKEALAKVEQNYKQEIQTREQKYHGLINQTLLPAAIKSVATNLNLTPAALEDLPRLLTGTIRMNTDTAQLEVIGQDGKPMTDEKLQPIRPEQFIETFVKARPYMMKDTMATGTGIRPGDGAGKPKFSMAEAEKNKELETAWKAADPEGYKKASAEFYSMGNLLQRQRAAAQK